MESKSPKEPKANPKKVLRKGNPKKPYGNAYEAIRETEMSHRPRESLAPYGNPQVSKGNLKGIRKIS